MEKNSRIYIAGHKGLVGSAICRKLCQEGYTNLIVRSHNELDLLDADAVRSFFEKEKPEYVFLAAAHVGGIHANNRYRADFIYYNLGIQQNVIGESYRNKVKKLLFLGSSCIYPRLAKQPIKENELLTGPLEYTNEPYAIAKIAGLKMCESFNLQYGTDFIAVMPTNLYGPNDNFDLETSHLLPAIVRKMHLAKLLREKDFDAIRLDLDRRPLSDANASSSEKQIVSALSWRGITHESLILWGTGTPLREMMHVDDLADACYFLMENISFNDLRPTESSLPINNCHINVGTGKEHSIRDIASMIQKTVGYEGSISFDREKPDGTPRKLLDVTKLQKLGWKASRTLEEGIVPYYDWYIDNLHCDD